MNPFPEVTCIGEAIVDFVAMRKGTTLSETGGFLKLAGGAPANVAVGIAKLGGRSAFAGRVGDDSFGRFLCSELNRYRVDTSGVRFDREHKTRLAFVSFTKSGDRDFEFWEKSPADEQLRPEDVDGARVSGSKIVALSSFLLLREPARDSFFAIARKLRHRGTLVAFDPNLRLSLWKSRGEAKRVVMRALRFSQILRMNDEEAAFLTGEPNVGRAAGLLMSMGPSLVVVTLGKAGCYFRTKAHAGRVPGFGVKNPDTTGCGDGFYASLLFSLSRTEGETTTLSASELASICRTANAAGALTASHRGAIPALPTAAMLKRFLASGKRGNA
ncbi:MAG TPA: carbohydrate kinase [Bacteroidota bacterium]|nr:carbohydrate kinase [Bacteroidota bacterium]